MKLEQQTTDTVEPVRTKRSNAVSAILREPLTHFVLLGVVLFVLFGLVGKFSTISAPQITVSSEKIQELIKNFQFDNKRPPTAAEIDRIINDYVREEVLCREAINQGLPLEIPSVRLALRQKMEFQSDSAESAPPTDQQLEQFLSDHAAQFRKPDGNVPALTDVRDSVETAWAAAAQRAAREAAYEKLKSNYRIIVQRPATTEPTTKMAGAK